MRMIILTTSIIYLKFNFIILLNRKYILDFFLFCVL